MDITESQSKAYVAEGGTKCPHCGSEELVASNQIIEKDGIYFDCECSECLREWKEHYVLARIFTKDESEPESSDLV